MLLTFAADRRRCSPPHSLLLSATDDCLEAFWELTNKINLTAIRESTFKQSEKHPHKKIMKASFLQVTCTKKGDRNQTQKLIFFFEMIFTISIEQSISVI